MTHQQLGQWLTALKSGKYVQYQKGLYSPAEQKHCCLGVLSAEMHFRSSRGLHYPPEAFLDGAVLTHCTILNDDGPVDDYRRVIADIEGALEEYISETEWR